MDKLSFTRVRGKHLSMVNVEITLVNWVDDKVYFAYSPSLDITGYGYSNSEAMKSFDVALEEFFKYTHNKGTIFDELEHLGWAVNRKKKKVIAPEFDELLEDNETYREITEKAHYTQGNKVAQLEVA